jgi:hypothetical protein
MKQRDVAILLEASLISKFGSQSLRNFWESPSDHEGIPCFDYVDNRSAILKAIDIFFSIISLPNFDWAARMTSLQSKARLKSDTSSPLSFYGVNFKISQWVKLWRVHNNHRKEDQIILK